MCWTNEEIIALYLFGMFWGIMIGEPLWRIVHFLGEPSEVIDETD